MNELMQVAGRQVGEALVDTVSARDLHGFLAIGKQFSHWVQERIEQYGFEGNRDFVTFSPNGLKGRPTMEYAITLDMAKELAMVERTEKGKQARLYFLECERRAKAGSATAVLADPASLRALLLGYTERVLELEASVAEMKPKAEFAEAVSAAVNCQTLQEVAKVLNTGPNRLFAFLRKAGVLMRDNLPYQEHIDSGHFRVVEKSWNDSEGESHSYTRTLVTGKGLQFIERGLREGARA